MAREYQADLVLPDEERIKNWRPRIIEFVGVVAGFRRLTQAAVALDDQPAKPLRAILKDIVAGSILQDFSPR